jgi:hypothetical protein
MECAHFGLVEMQYGKKAKIVGTDIDGEELAIICGYADELTIITVY